MSFDLNETHHSAMCNDILLALLINAGVPMKVLETVKFSLFLKAHAHAVGGRVKLRIRTPIQNCNIPFGGSRTWYMNIICIGAVTTTERRKRNITSD